MDRPWKVIVAFIGVFIAGAVFGGFFTLRATGKRMAERPAQPAAPSVSAPATQPSGTATTPAAAPGTAATPGTASAAAAKVTPQAGISITLMRQFSRLKLTNTQKEKIKPLVDRAADDLSRMRKRVAEQNRDNAETTARVLERMYEDVGAWLTPAQRDDLEDMRQKALEKQAELRKKQKADAAAAAAPAAKTAPPPTTPTPRPKGSQ